MALGGADASRPNRGVRTREGLDPGGGGIKRIRERHRGKERAPHLVRRRIAIIGAVRNPKAGGAIGLDGQAVENVNLQTRPECLPHGRLGA